jgi:hypothetical protein
LAHPPLGRPQQINREPRDASATYSAIVIALAMRGQEVATMQFEDIFSPPREPSASACLWRPSRQTRCFRYQVVMKSRRFA